MYKHQYVECRRSQCVAEWAKRGTFCNGHAPAAYFVLGRKH